MSTSPGSSSTRSTSTRSSPTRSVMRWLLDIGVYDRQGEAELCPVMILSVQPDRSAVMLDDLAAHREANPGAGIGRPVVQALEDHEDAVRVLSLDANAVVGHGEE